MDRLSEQARIGKVSLTVSDLARSLAFYVDRIGFGVHSKIRDCALLGVGGHDLLELVENKAATDPGKTTGLYHFAILLPSRLDLAKSLAHLVLTRTATQGFSDHLVSEAIYLPDPDRNGIEIYRDRSRESWPRNQDGSLRMGTLPLDVKKMLAVADEMGEPFTGLPTETTIGHVHLHVSNLHREEAFYKDVIGFDLVMRYGPSASFLSAGGYHHHIGINTWLGEGAPLPPPNSTGLRAFELIMPGEQDLKFLLERAANAKAEIIENDESIRLVDRSGNHITLITES